MDTLGGLSYKEIEEYRTLAKKLFWTKERWDNLNRLIGTDKGITKDKKQLFLNWNDRNIVKKISYVEEMLVENNGYQDALKWRKTNQYV